MLAADPHALLRGGGPLVVALLPAQEHVLELVHPRVGEQQRRVVGRDERRAGHDPVALRLEVLQEGAADVWAAHADGSHPHIMANRHVRRFVAIRSTSSAVVVRGAEGGEGGARRGRAEALAEEGAVEARGVGGLGPAGLAPAAGEGLARQRPFVGLGEHVANGRLGRAALDAEALQVALEPHRTAALEADGRPRERPGDAGVVDRALGLQARDGVVHRVRLAAAPGETLADLLLGELTTGEPPEGEDVGIHARSVRPRTEKSGPASAPGRRRPRMRASVRATRRSVRSRRPGAMRRASPAGPSPTSSRCPGP